MQRNLEDFIVEYGDRAKILLRAIYEETISPKENNYLGDFSLKGIKRRFKQYGINYNPSPLLRVLERDIGLIETSYKSSTQHWWKVTSISIIKKIVIGDVDTELTPKARLLKIQFYSIDPWNLLSELNKLSKKKQLTSTDKKRFRSIVFNTLPLLVEFLEESEEYENELISEREIAENILEVAETISYKIQAKITGSPLFLNESFGSNLSESISDKGYRI